MDSKASLEASLGKEETIAAFESLSARLQSGEIACAALRLFHSDGTWEDVAIGGIDDERAQAIDNMRKLYTQAN